MTATPRPECGVVARWAERPTSAQRSHCDECGEQLGPHTSQCPGCGQLAGRTVGMLAQVVEIPDGNRRLVICQRAPDGGWEPTRTLDATHETVRMVRHSASTATGEGSRCELTGQGALA